MTGNELIFKVLGSGSCIPKVERSSPGYFVKFRNKKFLMDCGPGILHQLVKAKEDYKDLAGVVFSHFHPDHTTDFIPLIQALNYTPGFKRENDLLLFGPPGLEKFIKCLYQAFDMEPVGYNVIYNELNGSYQIDNLYMSSIQGIHTETSIVTKITYKDSNGQERGLVYSGDTDFNPEIGEFAKNIDLLVLECSFPQKVDKHLTPEEAGRIAQMAGAKKLVLTHFYPPMDNPEIKIINRVKEYYMGKVLLAQDFLEIVI